VLAQKRRAFTLIELTIVVAILGALAAIAVPTYASTRIKSTEAACAKNRIVLQQSKLLWMVDNGKVDSDEIHFSNLLPDYVSELPVCPMNGHYALNGLQGQVSCSAHIE